MFEFATLEGAMACFSQVGFIGQSNCIFFATTHQTTSAWGFAGGFVDGMNKAQAGRAWAGYLINVNENGFGVLPLDRTNHKLKILIDDLSPRYDEFTFIPYQQLTEVRIKKIGLGNSYKHVIVKMANAPQYDWAVHTVEKLLPYHEQNFASFCEFYGKK